MAKTLASLIGPKQLAKPSDLPLVSGMAALLNVSTFFDDNTTAKAQTLGHRYTWTPHTATITTTPTAIVDLVGPGVIQFLAFSKVSGGAGSLIYAAELDGVTIWTKTVDLGNTDGFIPIGNVLWDTVNFQPLYGGVDLEDFRFDSSFKFTVATPSSTSGTDIKVIHRALST